MGTATETLRNIIYRWRISRDEADAINLVDKGDEFGAPQTTYILMTDEENGAAVWIGTERGEIRRFLRFYDDKTRAIRWAVREAEKYVRERNIPEASPDATND
jgi:hypothetical protein